MKNKIIVQCIICGQIRNDNGNWDGIEKPVIRKEPYSHTFCPKHFAEQIKTIKNLKVAK